MWIGTKAGARLGWSHMRGSVFGQRGKDDSHRETILIILIGEEKVDLESGGRRQNWVSVGVTKQELGEWVQVGAKTGIGCPEVILARYLTLGYKL